MRELILTIGTKEWSTWSLRGWLVMKASGLPFGERHVRLRQSETSTEAKRSSPSGLVPSLTVREEGQTYVVWDSLAIAEYLAEIAPDKQLWPEERQIRAHARSVSAEMHSGFAELRRQYSMEFARHIPDQQPTEGTSAAIKRIVEIWSECRSRYRGRGDYLFGNFGIADCFYAPVVSRFRTYDVTLSGDTARYAETMWAHPFMQEWLKGAEAEIAQGLV